MFARLLRLPVEKLLGETHAVAVSVRGFTPFAAVERRPILIEAIYTVVWIILDCDMGDSTIVAEKRGQGDSALHVRREGGMEGRLQRGRERGFEVWFICSMVSAGIAMACPFLRAS